MKPSSSACRCGRPCSRPAAASTDSNRPTASLRRALRRSAVSYAWPMRIEFTKMHGLGNDFMLFDLPADSAMPTREQWQVLSDRHTGVGFDQAVVLQPPRRHGTDAF